MKARFLLGLVLWGLHAGLAQAAAPLPPSPTKYVTDTAGVLSPQTVSDLNAKLENYEKETSDQVLVYLMPEVPGDYAMEDFTQRTFQSWGVGQKAKNNGVVLFVFPKNHKMRIEVGLGLEGALPDATAKQIIENELKPAFKRGDFDAGVTQGVNAILAATRGEYKGSGETQANSQGTSQSTTGIIVPFVIFLLIFIFASIVSAVQKARGTTYSSRRRSSTWIFPSGGGSSGGGGGDSGGGGFSGGGGDSGGGGASGSW